jgi:integrase
MKPFESPVGPLFESYVTYRAGLGYSEKLVRRTLLDFDRYLLDRNADLADLHSAFFLELKKALRKKQSTFNTMLRTLRGFFAYLERRQIVADNPLRDIPAYAPGAFIPFVFSRRQTDALIDAAQRLIRKNNPEAFFRDYSACMAIALLARCGMRIKEPLRLTVSDYRSGARTVYIEKTKFRKDRLIPLPLAVARALDTYLNVRTVWVGDDNPYLFPGKNGRALNAKNVYRLFDQSVKTIGIDAKRAIIANTSFGSPTPHSLRHSFAINTLKAVKARGGSPQNALPVLSAYLGHSKYRYTAVYLKVLDAEHRKSLVDFAIGRQEEL